MMRAAAALILVSVVSVLGQEPRRTLTFDVTSVRPNTSGAQGGSSKAEPGRYVGINVTVRRVMGLAYLPVQEFVGGPGWIDTDHFDIEGRVEGTPDREQMREMLRSLLADRFKLVVHRETRQLPAYALTVARAGRIGPELRRVEPCNTRPTPGQEPRARCGGFAIGMGTMRGDGITMTQLAGELASATEGRHVVDRTGLEGSFDLTLTWNADSLRPDAASAGNAPSIFVAIQEQLGLRLEPITAPIAVMVIDRVERPAAN
jgi:uncharacterized protein (TIGR03435 family)